MALRARTVLRYFQVAALPVRLCRFVAVDYTPTGALSADTPQAQYVLPNVRANRPAEAGGVRLARDSGEAAARQPYAACRSGSG